MQCCLDCKLLFEISLNARFFSGLVSTFESLSILLIRKECIPKSTTVFLQYCENRFGFFPIIGQPEFCIGNTTNGPQLKFTLCGVPKPNVTWGFLQNDTKNSINATERDDVYYAHDYSLSITPDMCAKTVYFKAVGYNKKTLSWNSTHNLNCESLLLLVVSRVYYIVV